jgi:hypothetical protein
MTDQATLSKAEFLELCRKDPGVFLSYVFDFPLADMHKQWLKGITEHSRTFICAPRCHAKTSICSIALPTWFLGNNPNLRIKVVSGSDDKAKDIVFAIFKTMRDSPRYKEVFPNVVLSNKRDSKQQIWLERSEKYNSLRDASVEALGVLSSAEGSRADILIFDDIITKRNSQTHSQRSFVKETYFNVHINLLGPEDTNKAIYIGTVWHRDDLTTDIMYTEGACNESGAHICQGYNKQVWAIDDDFNPLWPQAWPQPKLVKRCSEIGLRRFNVGFRNMPGAEGEYLFNDVLVESCVDPNLPLATIEEVALANIQRGEWKTVISIDLAGGKLKGRSQEEDDDSARDRRRRCYNVIFVTAVTQADQRIPIHIERFQGKSPETARLVYDQYQRWKSEVVMFEVNNFGVIAEWLGELVKMPIQTYWTGDQKMDDEIGVPSMVTELENRMWRIPTWEHDTNCKCHWCVWRAEVNSYPFGRYTDTVMAWWLSREAIRLHVGSMQSSGGFAMWGTK